MAHRKSRRPVLAVQQLDDRITPSSSGLHPAAVDMVELPPPGWFHGLASFVPVTSAAAADGKTWIVGSIQRGPMYFWWGHQDYALTRLNADGSVDSTFNNGQIHRLTTNRLDWFAIEQMQTGPDGKLYLLTRNRAWDPMPMTGETGSPGPGGPIVPGGDPRYSSPDLSMPMVVPPDGWPQPPLPFEQAGHALFRLNTDGTLDLSFDGDGVREFDLTSQNPAQRWSYWGNQARFDVLPNGSIIVAGSSGRYDQDANTGSIDVVKFTAAGALDTAFDGDGRKTISVSLSNDPAARTNVSVLAVSSINGGDLMIAASATEWYYTLTGPTRPQIAGAITARLNADGSADHQHDGDGLAITPLSPTQSRNGTVSDAEIASTGTVSFVGNLYPEPGDLTPTVPAGVPEPGFVIRVTPTGQLDSTLDYDGYLQLALTPNVPMIFGQEIELFGDGSFAIGGTESDFVTSNWVIAKFTSNGSIDPTFTPVRETPANYGSVLDLAILSNGGLLATVGYPGQLLSIPATGGRATTIVIAIPDNRWIPPIDFQPFPHLPEFRDCEADVNGDGTLDYIYVTQKGGTTEIRIVDGATGTDLISGFRAFEDSFHGGLFCAAGDFDGDGDDDVVVSPDDGGSARVQVFSLEGGAFVKKANFFAIPDPNFRGGGSIAVTDVNSDGTPDLVVGAAKTGGPRIATFNGKSMFQPNGVMPEKLFGDYFAPIAGVDPATYRGGLELRVEDLNGDGRGDVVMFPTVSVPGGQNGAAVLGMEDSRNLRIRQLAENGAAGDEKFLDWMTGWFGERS